MLRRCLPAFVSALVLITLLSATPAIAADPIPPDTACRNGMVSLTFDDGPHEANTPRLLKVLRKHHAQATFFVTGVNATRYPAQLRAMVRDGHAVEVHSWDHPDLTSRSDRSVRRQLGLTKSAIRRAIGRSPKFYRPPYGATERRVRTIAKRQRLREVLWTVDTDDWRHRSTSQIARAALSGLRQHRENVILMHDAVDNSPRTIKAVPRIIKGLRKKGYCLVPLEQMTPLGSLSAPAQEFAEGSARSTVVRIAFELDGPAQRAGSFRVRSIAGSAIEEVDFQRVDRIVRVRRGARSVAINLRIFGDDMPNADKSLSIRVDRPRNLKIATPSVPVTIRDDGAWHSTITEMMAPVFKNPAKVAS